MKVSRPVLSVNEISHIARLAKLRLEPEEEQALADDLSRVLDYIDRLGEVAVHADIELSTGGMEEREDIARPGMETEVFLENAPKTLDRFLLVPAIK